MAVLPAGAPDSAKIAYLKNVPTVSGSASVDSKANGTSFTTSQTNGTTYVAGGNKIGQASYHPVASGTGVSDPGGKKPEGNQPAASGWDPSMAKPSQADLAAERARNLANYSGSTPAAEAAAATPVDTSYLKTDLTGGEANAKATAEMLKAAGYDTANAPAKLDVPGQVALPNKVDLPNVDLPNRIANPNVALPNEIALPDEVNLPDAINFEDAMRQAGVNVGRVDNINIDEEKAMLNQLTEAQRKQAINSADYNVAKNTADLQRTMQDAQDQFGAQRSQIDIDEQRALDNQALYNETRGDRGGIGQAQYNTIQNTAATNRLTVQKEQTQLATDTARQIADLRAQGEFEKANQLLSISQNYLSQLMDLSTWAKEANIGIDEFNLQVAQWEENYKLSLVDAQLDAQASNLNLAQAMMQQNMNRFNAAYQQENSLYNARWNQAQQLWQNDYNQENSLYNARWNQATDLFNAAYNQENSQFEARRNVANDYFNNQLNAANYGLNASKAALEAQINAANATGVLANGTPTYASQQNARQVLAASGQALLEKGIIPTAEQLQAMGMTAAQASQYTGGTSSSGRTSLSKIGW